MAGSEGEIPVPDAMTIMDEDDSGQKPKSAFWKCISINKRWIMPLAFILLIGLIIATVLLAILVANYVANAIGIDIYNQPPTWPNRTRSALGNFSKAAVAADDGICSGIGRTILIRGGNAVDSAIATMFCTGVMDAHSSGLGGGHFMTIYNRTTKTCFIIDAWGQAPLAASREMFVNDTEGSRTGSFRIFRDHRYISGHGWLAVAVPGEIYGLYTAYKLAGSGKIQWPDLVLPTANLCQFGFPVSGALSNAIRSQEEIIMKEESLKNVFVNNQTGHLFEAGEIMHFWELANTLYQLAYAPDPIEWFYNSNWTDAMAAEFQENGGVMTTRDFHEYRAKYGDERPAIRTKIDADLAACSPPPPSASAITLAIINILQGYNITQNKLHQLDYQTEAYHWLLEAMKFAYRWRSWLGDVDFVDGALEIAQKITSPEYGAFIRSMITDWAHEDISYYSQELRSPVPDDHGTARVSVLDEEGNAVSLTSTINLYFGARVRSLSTGIIWNDQMDDFWSPHEYSFHEPPNANTIEPRKRTLCSISPVIVYNTTSGDVKIVTGAAGGTRIISATAQVIMRLLWFGQEVNEAVSLPRLHNQLMPFQSEFEVGFPAVYLQRLISQGHNFTTYGILSTVSTAIHRGDDGRIYASSDYRKPGGYSSGY